MNEFETTVIYTLDRQSKAQADQAKAQESFRSTVLLWLVIFRDELQELREDVLAIKGIAPDTKQELADANATEQALKKLAEAEDTELFLSWCAKSKAIEDKIIEAQRAIMSFEEELEKTSTDNATVLKAKDWFIDDCFQISCQTLRTVDMAWGFGSVRCGMREEFGLPADIQDEP